MYNTFARLIPQGTRRLYFNFNKELTRINLSSNKAAYDPLGAATVVNQCQVWWPLYTLTSKQLSGETSIEQQTTCEG